MQAEQSGASEATVKTDDGVEFVVGFPVGSSAHVCLDHRCDDGDGLLGGGFGGRVPRLSEERGHLLSFNSHGYEPGSLRTQTASGCSRPRS